MKKMSPTSYIVSDVWLRREIVWLNKFKRANNCKKNFVSNWVIVETMNWSLDILLQPSQHQIWVLDSTFAETSMGVRAPLHPQEGFADYWSTVVLCTVGSSCTTYSTKTVLERFVPLASAWAGLLPIEWSLYISRANSPRQVYQVLTGSHHGFSSQFARPSNLCPGISLGLDLLDNSSNS